MTSPSSLAVADALPLFTAPRVNSKSSAKAMECPTHYAEVYVKNNLALRSISSPMALSGTSFHAYRAAYVQHLMETNYRRDVPWALAWLNAQGFSDDANRIIERDIDQFEIEPSDVIGTEIFLSIDAEMRPLERVYGFDSPGYRSQHPEATDSGTIDLLLCRDGVGRVVDAKAGWSTSNVHEKEPGYYAGLVFAHFPEIHTVQFVWDFARVRATKRVDYTRADLPAIQRMLRDQHARKQAIVDRMNRGEPLAVNPYAGLCPFCSINCSAKQEATSGVIDIPPVQTLADAQRAAGIVYIAELLGAKGREALRSWIDANGPVPLPHDWEATIAVQQSKSLPLVETLRTLGIIAMPEDIARQLLIPHLRENSAGQTAEMAELLDRMAPAISPAFDVPLGKLRVGSTELSGYAKAKKRAGLAERLDAIATKKPVSPVKIRRKGEESDGDD